jgi:16S rRNA (cytosine1402-N4)-methyltransferase
VKTLETTKDLVQVILKALPTRGKKYETERPGWARRHPATRVFQALRIAVNSELEALAEGLPKIWKRLRRNGRLAIITFHSLEDRIVKQRFRQWQQEGVGRLLTKKPIGPTEEEILENPRARTAKLRAVEKVA